MVTEMRSRKSDGRKCHSSGNSWLELKEERVTFVREDE